LIVYVMIVFFLSFTIIFVKVIIPLPVAVPEC
jgi:hypothetical protein